MFQFHSRIHVLTPKTHLKPSINLHTEVQKRISDSDRFMVIISRHVLK